MAEYNAAKKILVLKDKHCQSGKVRSVYEQYALLLEKEILSEKQLFHAFLELPEYWEVRTDGRRGAVFHMGRRNAYIYYRKPEWERMVERVEWIDSEENVFRTDYYNCFGYVFAPWPRRRSRAPEMRCSERRRAPRK